MTLVEKNGKQYALILLRDLTKQNEVQIQLDQANFLLEKVVEERSEESKRTLALVSRGDVHDRLVGLQRQYESILQSAGEGIYGLDTQGFTTFANAAAIKMVGWNLEEMIGKSQHDLIHHTTVDGKPFNKKRCSIYAAFNDGKVHHEESEVPILESYRKFRD